MHLYLMRHADPDYPNKTLTETGFAEAKALGKRMTAHGVDYIYSSPAPRARITAEHTANLVNKEIHERNWLIEPPIGTVQQDKSYAIWDTFGETVRNGEKMPTEDNWFHALPFSETTIKEVWDNFCKEMDELMKYHGYERINGRYKILSGNRDHIALFSHNGTNLMLISYFLQLPLSLVCSGIFTWPSSVTTIYFEEHSKEWAVPRALGIADISHIYKAGLTPVPRGLGAEPYEPYL